MLSVSALLTFGHAPSSVALHLYIANGGVGNCFCTASERCACHESDIAFNTRWKYIAGARAAAKKCTRRTRLGWDLMCSVPRVLFFECRCHGVGTAHGHPKIKGCCLASAPSSTPTVILRVRGSMGWAMGDAWLRQRRCGGRDKGETRVERTREKEERKKKQSHKHERQEGQGQRGDKGDGVRRQAPEARVSQQRRLTHPSSARPRVSRARVAAAHAGAYSAPSALMMAQRGLARVSARVRASQMRVCDEVARLLVMLLRVKRDVVACDVVACDVVAGQE